MKQKTWIKYSVKSMMGEVVNGEINLNWAFDADLVNNFDKTMRYLERDAGCYIKEVLEFESGTK